MQPTEFSNSLLFTIVVRVLLAVLIVYIGRWLAHRSRPAIGRFLHTPRIAAVIGAALVKQFERLAYGLILGASILLAAVVLGVPVTFLAASMGLIVVILAVALRESLANFAATVIFVIFEPFRKGEVVQTMGFLGTVADIQLFNTVLLLGDRRQVSLPNQEIQNAGVVNLSRTGTLRAEVECVVAYDTNLADVRRVLLAVGIAEPRALPEPPPGVWFMEMRENGVRVALRLFVLEGDKDSVESDLRLRVQAALHEAGIGFAEYKHAVHGIAGDAPLLLPPPLPE